MLASHSGHSLALTVLCVTVGLSDSDEHTAVTVPRDTVNDSEAASGSGVTVHVTAVQTRLALIPKGEKAGILRRG